MLWGLLDEVPTLKLDEASKIGAPRSILPVARA